MTSKTQWGAGMKISIRHELDPYIQASRITGGCTSGTSGSMNYMTGYSAPSGTSSQCFGFLMLAAPLLSQCQKIPPKWDIFNTSLVALGIVLAIVSPALFFGQDLKVESSQLYILI